jgi:hypothetical protein
MKFKTKAGELFDMVPNGVQCSKVKKELNFMDKCPGLKFDASGEFCVPELCEFFFDTHSNFEIKSLDEV